MMRRILRRLPWRLPSSLAAMLDAWIVVACAIAFFVLMLAVTGL